MEDYIRGKYGGKVWTGFIWPSVEATGGIL